MSCCFVHLSVVADLTLDGCGRHRGRFAARNRGPARQLRLRQRCARCSRSPLPTCRPTNLLFYRRWKFGCRNLLPQLVADPSCVPQCLCCCSMQRRCRSGSGPFSNLRKSTLATSIDSESVPSCLEADVALSVFCVRLVGLCDYATASLWATIRSCSAPSLRACPAGP